MNKKEIGLFIIILLIDLLTKQFIQTTMTLGESIVVIENFFHITYVINTGAAWSMLEGQMWFFYGITVFAFVIIGWMLKETSQKDVFSRIGLVMILSGAMGNFIDRILFQHVRDFLDFYIFGYDFPVFNVADMSLCIGVFITLVIVLFKKEDSHESA